MQLIYIGCCVALLVGLKFYLIAGSEIIASHDDPEVYVNYAWYGYWSSTELWKGLYQPGYPVWLELIRATGVPLRLATEICYMGAAAYASYAVAFRRSVALGITIFAALIFSPETVFFFPDVRSENLVVICILCGVGSSILILRDDRLARRVGHTVILSLAWATIVTARTEFSILCCCGVLFMAWAFIQWCRLRNGYGLFLKMISVAVIPAVFSLLVLFGVSQANETILGFRGVSVMTGPAMTRLYDRLIAIDAGAGERYVTVDAEVRKIAYTVSPTFREIENPLERMNAPVQDVGTAPVPNDIPTGIIYWRIVQALAIVHPDYDLARQDHWLRQAADEIETALDRGALKRRPIFISWLDPRYRTWLPLLPGAMRQVVLEVVDQPWTKKQEAFCDQPGTDPIIWDAVANRRSALECKSSSSAPPIPPNASRDDLVAFLYRIKRIVLIAGATASIGLAGFRVLWRTRPRDDRDDGAMIILSVIGIYVSSRLLFYGLVNTCMWRTPPRFVFPVMPLITIAAIVAIHRLGGMLTSKGNRSVSGG